MYGGDEGETHCISPLRRLLSLYKRWHSQVRSAVGFSTFPCSLLLTLIAGKVVLFLALCGQLCAILLREVLLFEVIFIQRLIACKIKSDHASSLRSASPAVEVNATIRPVSFFAMRICFSTSTFNSGDKRNTDSKHKLPAAHVSVVIAA